MAHTMMLYVRVVCSTTTAEISKTIVAVSAGIALLGMRHAECKPKGYGKQHGDEECQKDVKSSNTCKCILWRSKEII